MAHIKNGTPVKIKCHTHQSNGLTGVVKERDGENYTVELDGFVVQNKTLYGVYNCEFEVVGQ